MQLVHLGHHMPDLSYHTPARSHHQGKWNGYFLHASKILCGSAFKCQFKIDGIYLNSCAHVDQEGSFFGGDKAYKAIK